MSAFPNVTLTNDALAGAPIWTANWATLLWAVIGLSITMLVLLVVYRTMQRPRLYIVEHLDRPPTATWQAVLRYVVTTPFLVLFWYLVILLVITTASADRTGEEIVVLSAGVIGAARVLAHFHTEAAHELGKTIPLAVLSLVLIGGTLSGENRWIDVMTEWESNAGIIDSYYWLLVLFDCIITAGWFLAQRIIWKRRHQIDAGHQGAHRPGRFMAVVNFGKGVPRPTKDH